MAEERLEEIREQRLKKRADLLAQGQVPYPAEAQRSHPLAEVIESSADLTAAGTPVTITGRVMGIRRHGGVVFLDLRDESGSIQLQGTKQDMLPELFERWDILDVGDFLQASGPLVTTSRGVLTVSVREYHVLSKSIRPLPSAWYGFKDHETRYRQREVDLLLNDQARRAIVQRSRLTQWLRQYLVEAGYLEVETPVLQPISGGAAARPFVTHHNTLDINLYLRISAELYLKRLLVAGFEKVFEIGPRFRNEGLSRQHNPEFSMLESQWAYADYEDLMTFTEEILERLFTDLTGQTTLTWQNEELSFAGPLPRVRYVDRMSEVVGFDILTEQEPARYEALFAQHGLELPAARTYYHLVDELYKELVRPQLRQPTLVYDYPAVMAPLAKRSLQDPRVAEKFQTVAAGIELNNCYTELNDPVLQRQLLEEQQTHREAGDEEAHTIDEAYLRAMEYGMPPNAGWSLGIDRMVMLLADVPSIRDTAAFPLLRPEQPL